MQAPSRTPAQADERTRLATYLHFGYLPRVEPGFRDLPWSRLRPADVARAADCEREELIARGLRAFHAACGDPGDAPQIVPLSGGIDSRLILAVLLARGLRERIVAVTFGIPRTLDFEIAPLVARAAGVRHEVIDLTDSPMTRAELLDLAREAPWSTLFEVFYNRLVFRRCGAAATYWSGNQANSLAGEDVDEVDTDWTSTCRKWSAELPGARSHVLTPPDFRPESALPARPPLETSCLNHAEQLFMLVRNHGRNDPAQLPPGFDVRTPFRRPEWVDFILRVPAEIRSQGRFYHQLAARSDPALFALPVKNLLGLSMGAPPWRFELRRARYKAERLFKARLPLRRSLPDPKLNYADFDAELRGSSPLAEVVGDSLRRLEELGTIDWLQPLELWRRHRSGKANLGDALLLLASLELNLAANGAPPRVE